MVHIEKVDLALLAVTLPSEGVGMVITQPFLSLTKIEPFHCTELSKPDQLQMVRDTLAVARAAKHGATKTHFTVFPEYSIPGPDGIALIDIALAHADWPTSTIVIGGIDALSKAEFSALAGAAGTHLDTAHNNLDRIEQDEWINCCITWVKDGNGNVSRWLQPKLAPASQEQNVAYQNMFCGASVFMFKGTLENGTSFRFSSLICFDWIASVNNQKIWRWVLSDIDQQAINLQADALALSWFFVIQYNPKPSHPTFLTEVGGFFDQTNLHRVRRDQACLVFANCAGKSVPGRTDEYGNTALLFSPQTLFANAPCPLTFSNGGQRYRASTLLSAYRDMLFRERGACVHSFFQVNPNSLSAGPAGRTIALKNAFVFPLGKCNDPRVPSGPVPACVKWLNDKLENIKSLKVIYPKVPLAQSAGTVHDVTLDALRAIAPRSVQYAILLASSETQKDSNADTWTDHETEALEHLVHTLDIFGIGLTSPTLDTDSAHATITLGEEKIDLMAIRGSSHESCIKHSKQFPPQTRRRVLLVSRDTDNNLWDKRFGNFLQVERPQIDQERNITDPSSGFLHLGYRTLLDIFQLSTSPDTANGKINDSLTA